MGTVILAAVVGAGILAACGKAPGTREGRGDSSSGAAPGDFLTFAIGNDLSNMDPALIIDIESAMVATQVYQGLLKFKADSVEVEPDLAEKYEVSPDGLSWTFHLRDGVRFHDGTPLTAEAVVFSVQRQMDPNHPAHVPGKMQYANVLYGDPSTSESTLVKSVDAPDVRTVVFQLARPYQPFAKYLAMTPAAVVSPAAVRTLGDDFNTTMVGTGPFRLRSVQRDSQVSLVRNEEYWGRKSGLEEIRLRILRDPNVRISSLQKGEVDVITGVEPTAIETLRSAPDVAILSEPSMNLGYLMVNNEKTPFNNRLVRLALNHAIDRSSIVDKLFSGTSVVARGILPPGMTGFDPDRKGFEYSPEKAKELLAQAGYPNGFEVRFLTHNSPRIYNPAGAKLAERIQQDLAKVGIRVQLDTMEFLSFLDRTQSGDYQMANSGWVTDNGDPDNFIYELAGREDNKSNYSNPAATRLMREAAAEPDEQKRAEMYRKAEDMLMEDPPFVPLNHGKQILAVRSRVRNLKLHPTGVTQLAPVTVEKDAR